MLQSTVAAATHEIPKIASVSREQFVEDYLKPQRPFILTDSVTQWPAMERWNLDYLAAQYSDHNVLVEYYPSGERYGAYTYQHMSVSDYIDKVVNDEELREQYYLADSLLASTLPRSVDDVITPDFIDSTDGHRPVVFIGYDTFSAAHYHRNRIQALLCQIQGEKKVCLYPAKHTKYLSPHPCFKLRTNFSQIPMNFDDHETAPAEYPNFNKAQLLKCTLQPGEMLFIPDHWMHTVAGYGENISITHFWNESWQHCYLPGLVRDFAAATNKSVMMNIARLSKFLGLQQQLFSIATKLGIVTKTEKDAILVHLEQFGVQTPATVNANQSTDNPS